MNTQNYPTWLVSLDIAIKLKEIGFNEYCPFFVYPKNDDNEYDDEVFISGTVTVEEEWLDEDNYGEVIIDLSVTECGKFNKLNFQTIPTWEQVFEWFREKGYHGVIAVGDESGEVNEYSYCINYLNELQCDFEQDSHLTYEEAREALVKALIQTYKSEQL